jgi:hypothetical protein
MTEKENRDDEIPPVESESQETPAPGPFDVLDELRRDIDRRIRDNKRFLERFLDEDFDDDDDDEGDEGELEWHEEEEL